MRWAQNNQGQFDDRLWQDKRYWSQAAAFWRDMARELKHHPAIAAYNLINEPAPEKQGGLAEHAELGQMQQWYAQAQDGARDLPLLYRQLIAAIREEDTDTPIMVDAGWYAGADAFGYWPAPLEDPRLLYSVHMYEPFEFTHQRVGDALNACVKERFAEQLARRPIGITVQVDEGHEVFDAKNSSLHPLFNKP